MEHWRRRSGDKLPVVEGHGVEVSEFNNSNPWSAAHYRSLQFWDLPISHSIEPFVEGEQECTGSCPKGSAFAAIVLVSIVVEQTIGYVRGWSTQEGTSAC